MNALRQKVIDMVIYGKLVFVLLTSRAFLKDHDILVFFIFTARAKF